MSSQFAGTVVLYILARSLRGLSSSSSFLALSAASERHSHRQHTPPVWILCLFSLLRTSSVFRSGVTLCFLSREQRCGGLFKLVLHFSHLALDFGYSVVENSQANYPLLFDIYGANKCKTKAFRFILHFFRSIEPL